MDVPSESIWLTELQNIPVGPGRDAGHQPIRILRDGQTFSSFFMIGFSFLTHGCRDPETSAILNIKVVLLKMRREPEDNVRNTQQRRERLLSVWPPAEAAAERSWEMKVKRKKRLNLICSKALQQDASEAEG